MINKFVQSVGEAMAGINDGAVVLVGGFGVVGQPNTLIDALIESGVTDLTIVSNNAGTGREGLAKLIELGRVRRIICSFPRMGSIGFEEQYRRGRLEVEIVPQGTLSERIRAAGAGISAFYTPTSVGTPLAQGKETKEINGRTYVLEYALPGDFALIQARDSDRWGNLTYNKAGRNFNPVMAAAANVTIAEVESEVELGATDPENVITPGIFVSRVLRTAPRVHWNESARP